MSDSSRALAALVVVVMSFTPALAQRAKPENPKSILEITQPQRDRQQAVLRRLMREFTEERQSYADRLTRERDYARFRRQADELAALLKPRGGRISEASIDRYFREMARLDREYSGMFRRTAESVRVDRRALDRSYAPIYRDLGFQAFERRDLIGLVTRYGLYKPQPPIQGNDAEIVLEPPFAKLPMNVSYPDSHPFAQAEADQATGEFSVFVAAAGHVRISQVFLGDLVHVPAGTSEMTVTAKLDLSSAAYAVDVDDELVDEEGNVWPAKAGSYLLICVFGGNSEDDYHVYPEDIWSIPVGEVIVAGPGMDSLTVPPGEVQITQTISTEGFVTALGTPVRAGLFSWVCAPGDCDGNLNVEGRVKEISVTFD